MTVKAKRHLYCNTAEDERVGIRVISEREERADAYCGYIQICGEIIGYFLQVQKLLKFILSFH